MFRSVMRCVFDILKYHINKVYAVCSRDSWSANDAMVKRVTECLGRVAVFAFNHVICVTCN